MTASALRRVAIAAAAIVALLAVALALLLATFDVNRYKPEIVAAIQQRTGRTLTFDGDLALSVFPRVAIRLPPTTISEPRRGDVAARLHAGSAKLALWPLLRKQLVVDAVRIEGLQTTIVRRKDGTTNFDDLLRPQAGPAPAAGPASDGPAAPSASIGRIELVNADVTLRDAAAGRTVRASALDLTLGRIAPSARTPVGVSGALTIDKPALNARIDAKAELAWDADGSLARIDNLTLSADGTWEQQPARLTAAADHLSSASQQLEVLALKAKLHVAGAAPIDAELGAPRLQVAAATASGERIELTLRRGGADSLDVKAIVEGVRGNAAALEASALRLTATARTGARVTSVDASSRIAASVDDRTLRLERATGEAVIEDPSLKGKTLRVPFTASAAVDGVRQTVALQLQSGADALKGRAKVDVAGFTAPRVSFDVDAEQIDVDRLLGPPASAAAASSAPAPAAGSSGKAVPAAADPKIDWAALRALNASGKLRVARLHLRGADVSDVRVSVQAAEGRIAVAPLALRVHGGSVDGRVALDARAGRAAMSGTFAGIDLRRAVGDLSKRAAIEGRANGTFDVAGSGMTVAQFRRSLGGKLAVEVRDGALIGIDLADLLGSAAGLLQTRHVAPPAAVQPAPAGARDELGAARRSSLHETGALDERKRTPFSQLSGSARIADGVAVNDDLKARSPQLEVSGSGRMDLVTTELDYTLRAQVVAGPATERTPLRSLAGVTVPVRISGPAEQPRYAVDWTAVAAEVLLKRASGRSGSPVNQVIEGLGDLLGRRKK